MFVFCFVFFVHLIELNVFFSTAIFAMLNFFCGFYFCFRFDEGGEPEHLRDMGTCPHQILTEFPFFTFDFHFGVFTFDLEDFLQFFSNVPNKYLNLPTPL